MAAAVARAPDNASPWAYLKGLLQLEGGSAALVHDQRIPQLCFQVPLAGCRAVHPLASGQFAGVGRLP